MSDDDMINQWLSKNEPKKCEDAEWTTDDTSRKANRLDGCCNLPKLNSRMVKKFICQNCGKEDSVQKKYDSGAYKKHGYVDGKYVGDTLCQACRRAEIAENKKQSRLRLETLRTYKTEENQLKCREIRESTTLTKIKKCSDINRVEEMLEGINFVISIIGEKEYLIARKDLLEDKLHGLNSNIDKSDVDWDDWDTPLNPDLE